MNSSSPTLIDEPKKRLLSNASLGISVIMIFFILSGITAYTNVNTLYKEVTGIVKIHDVNESLDAIFSLVKDAETGQRGYLLTNEESYLKYYINARSENQKRIYNLQSLSGETPDIATLKELIELKFEELEQTIELSRNEGTFAARKLVATDRGKIVMDQIRHHISVMREAQESNYANKLEQMSIAYQSALMVGIISCLLSLILAGLVGYFSRQTAINREVENAKQGLLLGLNEAMAGEQQMKELGESILAFLAQHFNAQSGAFYVNSDSVLYQTATYGVHEENSLPAQVSMGQGLMGQAVLDNKIHLINEVPEEYLCIGSALGKNKPRYIAILPAHEGRKRKVNSVLELGFLQSLDSKQLESLEELADSIGSAVKSAEYRQRQKDLLEETKRQGEEMQIQSDELKTSNEELEEQSTLLQESQARLEQQQEELTQINDQLLSQTKLLENERDALEKSKLAVQHKANELAKASQFKSDFLANMSHELRTPLNSLLILSKLLADNTQGNLTEEQVKFSSTIHASGNDLLTLINDVLDLSKIEAGHMEINVEEFQLKPLLSELKDTFTPLAGQKSIEFTIDVVEGNLPIIYSDRQRLEQVLRNLLSNAIKFTEKGSVSLKVDLHAKGRVAFSVSDTGIGISADEQKSIFAAFQQADSKISRRFGGTGLGLSISKEMMRILGGVIELESTYGEGSTFTAILPVRHDKSLVIPTVAERESEALSETMGQVDENNLVPTHLVPTHKVSISENNKINELNTTVDEVKPLYAFSDDREMLSKEKHTILVVEDDKSFAKILYDIAHELNFNCLVTSTAQDAIAIARTYLPSAVLLDIGLPDDSGLAVLDQLKQSKLTRHIAIHIVSARDDMHSVLSKGATSYIVKPVKYSELTNAFTDIKTKLNQKMRRVLLVEDNAVQRDSVISLLSADKVEIVAVGTAGECLAQLKTTTFDCMVLDLSLPDSSGYALLETLSEDDSYSFPPVIVYTGKDLSASDELELQKYSRSIIIKGAKSPERLLDEVTLFLHQVVSELPPEKQKMLDEAKSENADLKDRCILVVEDDVRNIYSLVSILEPYGVNVKIARNGFEALDALESQVNEGGEKIDLVLMDVMMPDMDGITAVQKIREQSIWADLPIIMLTAKAMKTDRDRCVQAGANDYLSKPIDINKLLSLIRVWMP